MTDQEFFERRKKELSASRTGMSDEQFMEQRKKQLFSSQPTPEQVIDSMRKRKLTPGVVQPTVKDYIDSIPNISPEYKRELYKYAGLKPSQDNMPIWQKKVTRTMTETLGVDEPGGAEQITTGNWLADKTADLVGWTSAMALPTGANGGSALGTANKLGTKTYQKVLEKLPTKTVVENGVKKAAPKVKSQVIAASAGGAAGMAPISLMESSLQNKDIKETGKKLALDTALGAGLGVAGVGVVKGAGKVAEKIIRKLKAGKLLTKTETEFVKNNPDFFVTPEGTIIKELKDYPLLLPPGKSRIIPRTGTGKYTVKPKPTGEYSIIKTPKDNIIPKTLPGKMKLKPEPTGQYKLLSKEQVVVPKTLSGTYRNAATPTGSYKIVEVPRGKPFSSSETKKILQPIYPELPERNTKKIRGLFNRAIIEPEYKIPRLPDRNTLRAKSVLNDTKLQPIYEARLPQPNRLAAKGLLNKPQQTEFNANPNRDMPFMATSGELSKVRPEPKFKVKINDNVPERVIDSTKITDTNGKPLSKVVYPETDELIQQINRDLEGANVVPDDGIKGIAPQIKDKSGLFYNFKDVYRNFKDAFGKHYDYVKAKYLDPFDRSKGQYVQMQKNYTDSLYDNVVKKLGIGKDTKESAAVQWFGEKKKPAKVTDPQTGKKIWTEVEYTIDNLKRDFPDKWQDIVEADKWFRKAYDELIDQVNATRAKIYPTNPSKLVPKRKDYYRHFREIADTFEGVKNLFETPSQIDPSLAGVSEFTKPKSKWASFMQKRGWGPYKADAVGGFLDYIKAASYATHIDPHISKFRGLAKDIAEATADTRNANKLIEYIQDFANDLAGKTSNVFLDRVLNKNFGRRFINVLNWVNSRDKANTILGNAASSLAQIANIPAGVAKIKNPVYLTKGAGDFMASILGKGKAANLYNKSQFISERYSDKLYSRFDTKMLEQSKRFAAWLLGVGDEIGTKFIWSSAYNKAVNEGIKNPIKYADDVTRSLVAGRGIGELALMQKAKTFQFVAPFQIEVANLWHIQKDFIKSKDFGALAMLYLANWLFNKGMEQVRGSGVIFDPIGALEDALKEEDTTVLQKAGRLIGEIGSNLPLGQTIAAMFPEDVRREYFGRTDPTRFGSGLLVTKGIADPVFKLLPPFGGTQLKKTLEGGAAVGVLPDLKPTDGLKPNPNFGKKQSIPASIRQDKEGNDKLRFPIEKSPQNVARSLLFGQYSTPEARRYFEEKISIFGKNQTDSFKKAVERGLNPEDVYEQVLAWRKLKPVGKNKGVTKLQKVVSLKNNSKFTPEQKRIMHFLFLERD